MTSRLLMLWLLAACLSASVKVVAQEEVEEEDDEEEPDFDANMCVDEHAKCGYWARHGECEENPNYMSETCRRSCNICVGDENSSMPSYVHYQKGGDLGAPQQLVFPDGTREEDIQWQIGKARNYMKYVVSQQFEYGMHELCQTKHENCAWWALLGECTENPEYMMEKCAPMCNSCEALTLEFKCPLDPEAEDAWEPEDGLNKMFERLTAEPFKSKYSVEILSSPATDGPWVITMDDVVSAEEAFRLIELGHEVGYERSTDVGDLRADGTHLNVKSEGRTSTNAWCKDECEEDESTQAVNARLQEITGIPQINTENLQLLRYEPDQFYEVHHDYIPHHIRLQSGPRILTVYLYLNDVAAGGGTNFDDLDITVMPKRGRALLWPSTLDEAPDQKDERTTHQALPVEAGIKFGANAWYHLRDFRTPSSTGCMG